LPKTGHICFPVTRGFIFPFKISFSYSLWFLICLILFVIIGNINIRQSNKHPPPITELLLFTALMPFMFFITQILVSDSVSFTDLNSIGNYDKFINCIEIKNPSYDSTEVVYYNDKYIFTKLYSAKDTVINLSKFEDFFITSDCSIP